MLSQLIGFLSFLRPKILFHCIYIPQVLDPSFDGHLGCFHTLGIVNNAAVNVGIQISLRDDGFVSFGSIPGSGIGGSYSSSV